MPARRASVRDESGLHRHLGDFGDSLDLSSEFHKIACEMVSQIVLLSLLLIASVTDMTRHRIYNWMTYPGILSGLALQFWQGGWDGLQNSLGGLAVCGGVMLLCFVLFDVGGGDVKLIAMMGAFLGVEDGITAMLWTFVIGSMMALAVVIWSLGIVRILQQAARHVRLVIQARGWIPLTQTERAPLQRTLFLAPAGFLAVCLQSGLAL